MEEEIEKKIKDLKEFVKQKTDQGTSNYLGKEIREICGMVESKALSQHDVIKSVCSCGSRLVKTTNGYYCGNAKCSVLFQTVL